MFGVALEDGSVALVSKNWVTPLKSESFWPPYKFNSSYEKALKTAEEPNEENWSIHKIKKIYFDSDDFTKTKRKLEALEYTSDIQSEVESTPNVRHEVEVNPEKRPRKKPKKLYSESESSHDDDDNESIENYNPRSKTHTLNKDINSNKTVVTKLTPNASVSQTYNSLKQRQSGCNEKNLPRPPPIVTTHSDSDDFIVQNVGIRSNKSINASEAGFQRQVISLLQNISQQNLKILQYLETSDKKVSDSVTVPKNISVRFPIESEENLKILEKHLEVEETATSLANYLSTLGGKDTVNKINTVLKFLLSDNLASNYSFFGKRQQKKAFNNLNLKSVIVCAIKDVSSATVREIEDAIKVWLKHSPQQAKRSQ